MTIQMTQKARNAAQSLAVNYKAYHDAVDTAAAWADIQTLNAVMVWGRALAKSQREVGVDMYREDSIERTLWQTREKIARLDTEGMTRMQGDIVRGARRQIEEGVSVFL